MLPTLLVSAALAGATLDAHAPSDRSAALELVVCVQESRLSLCNPTDAPELIVLADREHGRRVTITIAARAELEFRFVERALDGLDFTVLARGPEGLRASRTLPVAALRSAGGEQTTWFVSCTEHVHPWVQSGANWSPLEPSNDNSGAPQPCSLPAPSAPTHVPVITPSERQRGDLPPRLEKKPLPPV